MKVASFSTANGTQISMTSIDRLGQHPALFVAAISTLRVEFLRNLPSQCLAIPPSVELLRHGHRRDVIPVKARRVPPQVGEKHATAAGVASEPAPDTFQLFPLESRGVVEVWRGRYADAGKGSAGGVAGGRKRGESGSEDGLVGNQAENASNGGSNDYEWIIDFHFGELGGARITQ